MEPETSEEYWYWDPEAGDDRHDGKSRFLPVQSWARVLQLIGPVVTKPTTVQLTSGRTLEELPFEWPIVGGAGRFTLVGDGVHKQFGGPVPIAIPHIEEEPMTPRLRHPGDGQRPSRGFGQRRLKPGPQN
jgi:hypothetical protein